MASQIQIDQAKATYGKLCTALDNIGWKYRKDDERLFITCGVQGDDLGIDVAFTVDPERMVVLLTSAMPYIVQDDRRVDVAMAVSAINYLLADGCFDFDITTGKLYFRMSTSFYDSDLGEKVFSNMISAACQIIDVYNDKFLMVAKGVLNADDIVPKLEPAPAGDSKGNSEPIQIDVEKIELAKQVFDTLCKAIESRNWSFDKREESLSVYFGVKGDDLPMDFILVVGIERQMIRLLSPMKFNMSESKRIEGAIATCAASFGMADGNFIFDKQSGKIHFRMTESFTESVISEKLFHYMITYSCKMVDKYNDKFLSLDKGEISITEFLK